MRCRPLGLLSAAEKYSTLLFLTLSTEVGNIFSFSRFLVAIVSGADKRKGKWREVKGKCIAGDDFALFARLIELSRFVYLFSKSSAKEVNKAKAQAKSIR